MNFFTSDKQQNPHLYTANAIFERHERRMQHLTSIKGVRSKSSFKRKRNHIKLTPIQENEIMIKFRSGESTRKIAAQYLITQNRVRKICSVMEDYKAIAQSWINRGHRKKVIL